MNTDSGKTVLAGLGIIGVFAAPVVLLILMIVTILFGGSGDAVGNSENEAEQQKIVDSIRGDGKGTLDRSTVPDDLADAIDRAGALCPEIGPVVIASQLQLASGFDAALVGEDGKQGIAQLTPAQFGQFAQDEDDSGEVSPLDAEDSILALGRLDCSLVNQVGDITDGDVPVLDLALAAVQAGADAVRQAGGFPSDEARSYVAQVRVLFPRFEGLIPAPEQTVPPQAEAPAEEGR